MFNDIYTKHIPNECPSCKSSWKYPRCSYVGGYPMIAVCLNDSIDITCSNPRCKMNFKADKNKIELLESSYAITEKEL